MFLFFILEPDHLLKQRIDQAVPLFSICDQRRGTVDLAGLSGTDWSSWVTVAGAARGLATRQLTGRMGGAHPFVTLVLWF